MEGIDLGTLTGILATEEKLRKLLGPDAYKTRDGTFKALMTLDYNQYGEFYILINALKDHCLALRMSGIPVGGLDKPAP